MDFKSKNSFYKRIWLSTGRLFFLYMPIIGFLITPGIIRANIITDAVNAVRTLFVPADVSAESNSIIESSLSSTDISNALLASNNPDPVQREIPQLAMEDGFLIAEAGPSTEAPEETVNTGDQISVYLVRSGDTMAGIAKMFDVSVNTILWANDMSKSSVLKVGQTLVILPMSGVLHTVAKGDTLNSIAKKYGGDINEIADFNDLKISDKLSVGDTVLIPDGQVSSSIRPSAVATKSGATKLINGYSGPTYDGYYIKPFVGGHKTQGLHGYNGVDYGMPIGTPLYAAAAGTVLISKNSGWNGGYGNYVVIKHPNNTQTVYGHMNGTIVTVGQSVTQGQTIGYSGNSGNSTGPHLHFEIRGAKNPF